MNMTPDNNIYANSSDSRTQLLKSYLHRLNSGEELEAVRADFIKNFSDVDASEIMKAEQELLKEGTPLKDVQKLCDVHSALFHGATREEKIANAEKAVEEALKRRKSFPQTDYSDKNAKAAAFQFGKAHKIEAVNAAAAYNAFEEFFVNGMPCDHVNTVTKQSEDRISWEMTQDIHARYWNGSSKPYYAMRKSLMEGMLDGTGIVLQMSDTSHYTVFK